MAALNESSVQKKFLNVNKTQDSIQSLSLWVLHHKANSEKIVEHWFKVFKKSKIDHRLTLFYLCNDIVQTCKRRHAIMYKDAFKEVLRDAVLLVRDPSVRKSVERIFKIWKERKVYDAEFLEEIHDLLNNAKTSNTMNSKLLAEFQPATVFEKILEFSQFERDTEEKRTKLTLSGLDASSLEAVKQLKDRSNGKEFLQEFEDSCVKLEEYIKCVETELKDRATLMELLDESEVFYDAQYGEAKIVANAYKNFGQRVTNLKKKLDDHKKNLPSPTPSPTPDAPSPGNTPLHITQQYDNNDTVDMDLSDEEDKKKRRSGKRNTLPGLAAGAKSSFMTTKTGDGDSTPTKDERSFTPVMDEQENSNPIDFLTQLISQSQRDNKGGVELLKGLTSLTSNIKDLDNKDDDDNDDDDDDGKPTPNNWAAWKAKKELDVPPSSLAEMDPPPPEQVMSPEDFHPKTPQQAHQGPGQHVLHPALLPSPEAQPPPPPLMHPGPPQSPVAGTPMQLGAGSLPPMPQNMNSPPPLRPPVPTSMHQEPSRPPFSFRIAGPRQPNMLNMPPHGMPPPPPQSSGPNGMPPQPRPGLPSLQEALHPSDSSPRMPQSPQHHHFNHNIPPPNQPMPPHSMHPSMLSQRPPHMHNMQQSGMLPQQPNGPPPPQQGMPSLQGMPPHQGMPPRHGMPPHAIGQGPGLPPPSQQPGQTGMPPPTMQQPPQNLVPPPGMVPPRPGILPTNRPPPPLPTGHGPSNQQQNMPFNPGPRPGPPPPQPPSGPGPANNRPWAPGGPFIATSMAPPPYSGMSGQPTSPQQGSSPGNPFEAVGPPPRQTSAQGNEPKDSGNVAPGAPRKTSESAGLLDATQEFIANLKRKTTPATPTPSQVALDPLDALSKLLAGGTKSIGKDDNSLSAPNSDISEELSNIQNFLNKEPKSMTKSKDPRLDDYPPHAPRPPPPRRIDAGDEIFDRPLESRRPNSEIFERQSDSRRPNSDGFDRPPDSRRPNNEGFDRSSDSRRSNNEGFDRPSESRRNNDSYGKRRDERYDRHYERDNRRDYYDNHNRYDDRYDRDRDRYCEDYSHPPPPKRLTLPPPPPRTQRY